MLGHPTWKFKIELSVLQRKKINQQLTPSAINAEKCDSFFCLFGFLQDYDFLWRNAQKKTCICEEFNCAKLNSYIAVKSTNLEKKCPLKD